ncbi:DUF2304 domain-containing protein [Oscillospiraceae bacterium HV4-5-C5C]|nr:DUF2304 domain-containing protein [Oscillospiraceae bacterium HV4-5-C5C]
MTLALRLFLFIGAVLTLLLFLVQIRKKRLKIQYAIFWTFFSFFLVILSIFPTILVFFSKLLGVQSPANLLFVLTIFVLVLKLFQDTLKLSSLEHKLMTLAQEFALLKYDKHNRDE